MVPAASRPAIVSLLEQLKLGAHVRPLLASIGTRTSGTRAQASARLGRELLPPSSPALRSTLSSSQLSPGSVGERVLSVDLGIRNLAFCVCEVSPGKDGTEPRVTVREWRRVSLLPNRSSVGEAGEEEDVFHPRTLARVAHALLADRLLPSRPTALLLERQRFRSGGAAAVQEWTLRVNTLEAMLWAALEAMKVGSGAANLPAVWSMSPKAVAGFWLGGGGADEEAPVKKDRTKTKNKGEKVALVRSWLADDGAPWPLEFDDQARETRDAFVERRGRVKGSATAVTGKLDDLADCLLQAAAWVQWELNRGAIARADVKDITDVEALLRKLQARGAITS